MPDDKKTQNFWNFSEFPKIFQEILKTNPKNAVNYHVLQEFHVKIWEKSRISPFSLMISKFSLEIALNPKGPPLL